MLRTMAPLVRTTITTTTRLFGSAAPSSKSHPLQHNSSNTVNLTFIDHTGVRVTVAGRRGMTLYDIASAHQIDLGPLSIAGDVMRYNSSEWHEDVYGEGVGTAFDHVMLNNDWSDLVKPKDEIERMLLDAYWDEEDISEENSRLASQIVVTKEMEGLSVYVPDGLPDDCP